MVQHKKTIGLTSEQASRALQQYGFNELTQQRGISGLRVFLRQFANFIVWVLAVAAGISYGIGEVINFWVIVFIIAFVIIMGFLQEYKAERAMEALKKIVKPITTVIRDGHLMTVEAREVVPGDILALEIGDNIPADAELAEEVGLKTDESTLTGESVPVEKVKGDRIFAGTQIVNGRCKARVIATGMKTELGKIASMIQEKEEPTPLQERMDQLGKFLALIALGASVFILGVGILRGASALEMLIVALALAVAAVPEGLPLTMTLALSFGMNKMAKKNAIVRRMMAVETLGSTTMICSDKTGTITKNEMTVQHLYVDGRLVKVTGVGYKPVGFFQLNGKKIAHKADWADLFRVVVLCNNADLIEAGRRWEPVGDPTEVALLTLGGKAGFWREKLEHHYKRVEEILFTPARKMMTTIHHHDDDYFIATKGAPEEILDCCTHWQVNGKRRKLTAKNKKEILEKNRQFAHHALRVLGVAMKTVCCKNIPTKKVEEGLTFLGLVGMRDPARPEVKGAIQTCRLAGIEVMMITGDNEHTALSIARQIGMIGKGEVKALTGRTLDTMSERELLEAVKEVRVFARTHSEHKLRIVSVLKKLNHIVAMTGDGVNDAPALKRADIGIAMGIKGTDVAKGAADMILQDDHFATIVEAVKEGRRIYQNIEKFTAYLISRNFTEVILIFLGILFFDFSLLPLLAIQILFINAFDEEMPAIGLGMDVAQGNTMAIPPRSPDEPIMNRANSFMVFSVATFMALVTFIIYLTQNPSADIDHARTMVFATIIAMMIFDTYNFRSLRQSVFAIGIRNNRFLIFAVLFIVGATLFVMYYPVTQAVFKLTPLSILDWSVCVLAAMTTLVYMEVAKFFRRRMGW
ncbi:cation-transporting P-type ATPase [Candidatus Peregrinibacteria bacterium]|nr:cation-transporting P-type ATPase [Candidatus Peregrinibacteria bacterium]